MNVAVKMLQAPVDFLLQQDSVVGSNTGNPSTGNCPSGNNTTVRLVEKHSIVATLTVHMWNESMQPTGKCRLSHYVVAATTGLIISLLTVNSQYLFLLIFKQNGVARPYPRIRIGIFICLHCKSYAKDNNSLFIIFHVHQSIQMGLFNSK